MFPVIITCSFLHIVTKQSSSIPEEPFKSLESRWKKLGEREGSGGHPGAAVQKDTKPYDAGQGWAVLVAEKLIVGLALANNLPLVPSQKISYDE